MKFYITKRAQQEEMVSGPGIDNMIFTIQDMLGRGAPTEWDFSGFNKMHYPLFSMYAGMGPGTALPKTQVIQAMQALRTYAQTQLPNYPQLRMEVAQDLNLTQGTPQQDPNNKNVIKYIGQAPFNKLAFFIPNFRSMTKAKRIIADKMSELSNQGLSQFDKTVDRFSGNQVYPTYKAISKSKQHMDAYEIHPLFIIDLVPFLQGKGYDTSEMETHMSQSPLEGDGQKETTKKITAILNNDGSVTIDYNDNPGSKVREETKLMNFRGSRVEENGKVSFKWTNPKPTRDTLEHICDISEPRGYDCSELKAIIEQLPDVEEDQQKILIEVRDVTDDTNGRWHMAIKFLRKGTYEGETLKDILKYTFINYSKNLDEPEGSRSLNKETWETYIAGDMQEYMNFINSLNNRGYDSSVVSQIVASLIKKGIIEPMVGIGFLDGYKNKEEFYAELDKYNLPFELYEEQKEGVSKLYSHKSFLKGDETGTGKSIQSILAADMRVKQSGGRVVVITKNAVQDQFIEAIAEFIGLDSNDKTQISTDVNDKAQWTVLTYNKFGAPQTRKELTDELVRQVNNGEITCLLLDESHSVKNGNPSNKAGGTAAARGMTEEQTNLQIKNREHASNNTTFNVQDVSANVPFVWGLSATVVANKAIDVYNQLKAINHPLGKMSWGKFAVEFGAMVPGRYGLEDGTMEEQIEAVNKLKEFMFDHNVYDALSKKQLNEQMPDQIINKETIPVDQARLWYKVNQRLSKYKNPDLEVSQMQAFRNEIAIEKVDTTTRNVLNVLNQDRKVMVFTDFRDSLRELRENIQGHLNNRQMGEEVVSIYGGMSKKKRKEAIDKFKNDPNTKAIVINIIAGGTGLDFPNVTTDVFVNDYDWSVANDEQALGRAYRINSEQDVNVTYTIGEGTPDEEYYARLSHKKKIADIIHKMSMEQDALMKEGHRRGISRQLKAIERQLNDAKKEFALLEKTDKSFIKSLQKNIKNEIKSASGDNWYKRTKLAQQIINKKDTDKTYLNIGHSDEWEGVEGENYMWVLEDEGVSVKKETDHEPTHAEAFGSKNWGMRYYGRYDAISGELSINKPIVGVGQFRNVPEQLISLLKQKFQRINKIYIF